MQATRDMERCLSRGAKFQLIRCRNKKKLLRSQKTWPIYGRPVPCRAVSGRAGSPAESSTIRIHSNETSYTSFSRKNSTKCEWYEIWGNSLRRAQPVYMDVSEVYMLFQTANLLLKKIENIDIGGQNVFFYYRIDSWVQPV